MITNDYGVADRQRTLLQLMKDADQVMKDNNICYSLCGGTLLGAVRHKGFIPWDDDLDIMFDRKNFNKLIDLFNNNDNVISVNDSTELKMFRYLWIYRIQKNDNQKETIFVPTIDIFVMDNCPDNIVVRKLKLGLIKTLQGMMHQELELSNKSTLMKICLLATYGLGRVFSDEAKYKLYNRISEIGNKKRTQYITGYNDLFNLLNLRYSGNLMDEMERFPFEDINLPITSEYDNYLSTQYGDYMKLPPVEERLSIHITR